MNKDLKKALTALKKSEKQSLTADETALCAEQKLFVKYEPLSHNELVSRIKEIADRISINKAAVGFLYSISSGDMRYRTALSSLVWAKAMPVHNKELRSVYGGQTECRIFGGQFSPSQDN